MSIFDPLAPFDFAVEPFSDLDTATPSIQRLGFIANTPPGTGVVNSMLKTFMEALKKFDSATSVPFEIRVSPKIYAGGPLGAGPAMSPGWVITAPAQWASAANNTVVTAGGVAQHSAILENLGYVLGNRSLGPDFKIQLVSIRAFIDKAITGNNFTLSVVAQNDDDTPGSAALMSLAFTGTTSGFELKTEDNGGTPVDVDLSKTVIATMVAFPAGGTIGVSEVVLSFNLAQV